MSLDWIGLSRLVWGPASLMQRQALKTPKTHDLGTVTSRGCRL